MLETLGTAMKGAGAVSSTLTLCAIFTGAVALGAALIPMLATDFGLTAGGHVVQKAAKPAMPTSTVG
jgi:hypothetical protein